MMIDTLPPWFPLQKLKSEKSSPVSSDEWKKLIVDRINILGINGIKNISKDMDETRDEYIERCIEDIKAHQVLKLAVSLNPRLSAWFVENEGDLFQSRFNKSQWVEKKSILDFLFPEEDLDPIWMEIDDLSDYLKEDLREKFHLQDNKMVRRYTTYGSKYAVSEGADANRIIGIDFRYASFLVKHRKALLYKGWVIGSIDKLIGVIKHKFEYKINQELSIISEKTQTGGMAGFIKSIEEMSALINKLIKPKREYNMSGVVLKGEFEDYLRYYPPCIQELVSTVEKVGYIGHWERFQLGLFLKHTGMDIDDQLQYWYSKAVDNIGMSFAEFDKKAGYIIRHIYGQVGGKIDYEMPSCTTIQNKMYCFFRHVDVGLIDERLQEMKKEKNFESNKRNDFLIKEISDFSSRGFPNHACAKYLQLLVPTVPTKFIKIFHPMAYLQTALKSAKIVSKTEVTDVKVEGQIKSEDQEQSKSEVLTSNSESNKAQ